jgi:hypothetical protein
MGASDVSAQEANDDDTLPGGAVRGSSLVGGGTSTLPAGFADQTSQMLNEARPVRFASGGVVAGESQAAS